MIRQIVSRSALCGGLALLLASVGTCQFIEVVDGVESTRKLSGTVTMERSTPPGIEGVLVEDCSSDWERVIASTHSDRRGHFKLSNNSKTELHYLRFSIHNVRTQRVTVKITPTGDKQLSIVLHVAT